MFKGELFAKCPVEEYPGIAVESVMDSSRYFVLRIKDDNGKKTENSWVLVLSVCHAVDISHSKAVTLLFQLTL